MTSIPHQVEHLGLKLPPAPKPAANYDPAAAHPDRQLIVSGQLPLLENGQLLATGKVGAEVDLETAKICARQCALNALAVINAHVGGTFGNHFDRVLKLGVYVASTADFTDQHLVADAASELFHQVLAGPGRHARAAVGCVSLPKDAPVEIEAVVGLTDTRQESD